MTIREEVEAFRAYIEDVTGKPTSSDFFAPPKLVYHFLISARNSLMFSERKLKTLGRDLDRNVIQELMCVELEKVNKLDECPCAPHDDCFWLRSKKPIPRCVKGTPITIVTNYGTESFDYVEWNNFEYVVVRSRFDFIKTGNYYTLKDIYGDVYLYLYMNSRSTASGHLHSVSVRGVFENPIDVYEFSSCGEDRMCNVLDMEAYIPSDIRMDVYTLALQSYANFMKTSLGYDIINNANNDSKSKIQGL